jgi:hypothetical protein
MARGGGEAMESGGTGERECVWLFGAVKRIGCEVTAVR